MGISAAFHPALRTVTSSGTVLTGPFTLWGDSMATYGITLPTATVTYPKTEQSWENWQYSVVRRLYGYRPAITLSFPLIDGSATVLKQLQDLFTAGAGSETYAALQFNLFAASGESGAWRGVFPTTDWDPRRAGGKQGAWELELGLECRDLISAPGDWTVSLW